MRLALLMGKTLGELGRDMDSAELTQWLAFDRVHGLPDPWLQTGVAAATAITPWLKKGAKVDPLDYIPAKRRDPGTPSKTPAQIHALLSAHRARGEADRVHPAPD